ncbi:DUF6161 domain-containing protein [Chromobacterium violaceum]
MEEDIYCFFKDVKKASKSEKIKWMRAFDSRWSVLRPALEDVASPFRSNLFLNIYRILSEGVNTISLTMEERNKIFNQIFSEERLISVIENNADLIKSFVDDGNRLRISYAISYLLGEVIPDERLSAVDLELYVEVKNKIDRSENVFRSLLDGEEEGKLDNPPLVIPPQLDLAAARLCDLLLEKERLLQDKSEEFNQSVENFSKRLEKVIDGSVEDLNRFKVSHDGSVALQAPVRYWAAKRSKHKWVAICAAISLLLAMWGSLRYLSFEADFVKKSYAVHVDNVAKKKSPENNEKKVASGGKTTASNAKESASSPAVSEAIEDSNGWHFDLALLLLKATFCFWVVRIGVRFMLSHIHLENDAAERETMAKTYLALLRRGKIREEELGIVLGALFRPTGDGIVKDEGVPPSVMESLTKLKP